ncbi:MAG: potassium channel family protein [Alphaproteobacteria bacterium]|nr:potassium channel family protein [Alphaproteobacteria bacterium]
MSIAMAVSILLVSLTILVHYEALRLTSGVLPKLTAMAPRPRIIFVIFAVFAAHTVEVYLYAIGYWLLVGFDPAGTGAMVTHADGRPSQQFEDLIYFSTITFTTIGFGDMVPKGAVRLVSGVQGLNGLLLIGWSASFTYLCMEKLWPVHAERRHARAARHAARHREH